MHTHLSVRHLLNPFTVRLFLLVAVLCCVGAKGSPVSSPPAAEGYTIGIDLGTTYSCVGVYKDGRVHIISNDQGNRITPSYVAFSPNGERLVGDAAKNQASLNPKNTVFDVKRLIGRKFSDKEVQSDAKLLPFSIVNKQGKPYVEVDTNGAKKKLSPEEISAMVLTKMKTVAENYLGESVANAVITVPAYFNDAQRQATKDAGTIAGLNVQRIISEPTAAALAYGLNEKRNDKDKDTNILVYDLGGGTFDVSVLTIDGGIFEVLATSGDTHLGGEDFDQRIMKHLQRVVKKKMGKDISSNPRAMAKLRREAEKAKRTLSIQPTALVEVNSLVDGEDFSETLTRAKFEELNADLFKKTLKPVQKVLQQSGLRKSEIDEIVMVGGSTRIPKIQSLLKKFFNGKEINRGVDPDEAVAHGAAVLGAELSGKGHGEVLVLDVTPLSLGIETVGGMMTTIVDKDTTIPTKKSQVFSTHSDNQQAVTIRVFQGERARTKDNFFLGKFDLTGIPPAPRGTPQIEVTFEVDANGILSVSAEDKATQQKQHITIEASKGGLSQEEIDRMLKEAEESAQIDKEIREAVEARNALEGQAYTLKNQIADQDKLGGRLDESEESAIQEAIDAVIEWLEDNPEADKDDCDEQKAALEAVANPIISKIYQESGGHGFGGSGDEGFDDGDMDDDEFADEL